MKKMQHINKFKITPPISGVMIAIIAIFSIVLASCSKDEILSDYSLIRITRDHILSNGLWRFAVSFDAQAEGDSYAIDVDPDTGEIIWAISTTQMPGGEFTLC